MENEVERVEYIKLVSGRLSLSYEAVSDEVLKYAGKLQKIGSKRDNIGKNRYTRGRVLAPKIPVFTGPEHTLVWAAVENPDLLKNIEEQVGIDNFTEPFLREILHVIKNRLEAGDTIEPFSLINWVSEEESKQFISQMTMREFPPADSPGLVEKNIQRVRQHIWKHEIIQKQEQLAQAQKTGDVELQKKYLEEMNRLCKLKDSSYNTGIRNRNNHFERGE